MAKTLTIRINDKTYQMFKNAAETERRNLSNFIENATCEYIEYQMYVSDDEMTEIMKDAPKIRKALKDVKKGKYKIVG